jgi:hypothetical protein
MEHEKNSTLREVGHARDELFFQHLLEHALLSYLLFFVHLEAAVLFSDDQHIPALAVGYPYCAHGEFRQFLYVFLRFQSGEYEGCGHKSNYGPDEAQIEELTH